MDWTLQGKKIVIADDEPIARINLQDAMEKIGCEVTAAVSNGLEAVSACRKYKPDIVLLDVKMPLMDGLVAAREISRDGTADTIVMITAYNDLSFIEEAVKNGANGYIVKPVNENILIPNLLVAHAKSKEIQGLHQEIHKVEEDLAARRVIEHAKGYLMDKEHMTEDSAYVYIRTLSRENRMSMKEVAEMLLEAKERESH